MDQLALANRDQLALANRIIGSGKQGSLALANRDHWHGQELRKEDDHVLRWRMGVKERV